MGRAFVIRPFSTKEDSSGANIDFDLVHETLIGPALAANGLDGSTTGEIIDAGNIREDMFELILVADLVVCDITINNANVFYELGIRHALRAKHTILLKGQPTSDGTPFDLLTDRYLAYDVADPAASLADLTATIGATLSSERVSDSPIFKLLPDLPEADPTKVQVVPLDFVEEVDRARASGMKGWLRLLSQEVQIRPWQWQGLERVGKAQWSLKDYEGARETWELVRGMHRLDIDANLALANIYERLYGESKDPQQLELSNQAIRRILEDGQPSMKERAEALALSGRNRKTGWTLDLPKDGTVEERRKAGTNPALLDSYKAYRDAFFHDLNHFYPGLAALQMGTIAAEVSASDEWFEAFDDDQKAEAYRETLADELAGLRFTVKASVSRALGSQTLGDDDRTWAEISNADVLFLIPGQREQRVVKAYRDSVPVDDPFAWDAASRQLELFKSLGLHAELAEMVLDDLNGRIESKKDESKKKVHVVIVSGHQIDAADRTTPRFPAAKELQARALLQEAIKDVVDDDHEILALSSGTPGADILGHEICGDLGLKSLLCLPMPPKNYASLVFADLDDWRSRFLDLEEKLDVLKLSHQEGLPNWLKGSDTDPWERGNRWVIDMAQSMGADRITLIALYDGKPQSEALGGTGHIVGLARAAGDIRIKIVDSKQLLASPLSSEAGGGAT